jgi:hypothetical protein
MYWLKQNKKNLYLLLLFFIAVLPAILPILQKGFFVTDDAEWMIIRLSAFYQALSDGQFPVRFLGRLNHEYGYPVATFLYPAFLYIGSAVYLLKIGIVEATKIVLGHSMVLSFLFTFFWLRKLYDKTASFFGAFFYLYAPYHLFDLYKRGSVGEVLALAVVPFVFWQFERRSIFFSATGIGLLILSHNSLAMFFLPVIVLYMLFELLRAKEKKYRFFRHIAALTLGAGLSAFFWIPAFFELQYTRFSETKISNPFEYFASSELIGYSTLLVLMIAGVLFIKKKSQIKEYQTALLLFMVSVIAIFLSSELSSLLWTVMPVGFVQFPFRLLSVMLICVSFLTAFVFSNLRGISKKIFVVVLLALLSISAYQYITTVEYFDKDEGFYVTNSATTTVHDEYMPLWVKEKPVQRPDEKVEIVKGEGKIIDIVYDNKNISFGTDLTTDATVQVNVIYWPGWKARIDGKASGISYSNGGGLMRVDVPGGAHKVALSFGETQLRLISDTISMVSVAALFVVAGKSTKIKDEAS